MPPTIHNNSQRSRATGEKKSDLVCRVKYNNQLPDIPFDPKFLTYPFDTNRYVQYNPTSLERSYKFELLTEHDLGVSIDLINPDTYKVNPNAKLHIDDELLLEDEVNIQTDSKRSQHHRQNVSWLRKTEYISTEYNRFVQSAQKAEARVGFNIKKQITDEVLYKDRDSQIKAIGDTFEAAMKPIKQHYSKSGVVPLEILPVYPDFEMWKHPCAQVIFDSDPAPPGKTVPAQLEEMSQAMIRGMVNESGEQFVAYFLPTAETLNKRKRDLEAEIDYEEDEEYDYVLAREYNWNVKNKASRGYEENYFFVFKDTGVYYNELETRVRLSKRRKIGASASVVTKSRLIVKHRPLTSQEVAALDARAMVLEPPGEEEEEMDAQHEEEAKKSDNEGAHSDAEEKRSNASRRSRSHSGSPRRSASGSPRRSASGSPRRSASGSPRRSASGSPRRSASGSPRRSASGSPRRSASGSPRRSVSGSPRRSASGSPRRSASGSPHRSASGSPRRSASGSPRRSASGSPRRSASGSPRRSASGSPRRSASGSPRRSMSGSPRRSARGSPRRSRSPTPSD